MTEIKRDEKGRFVKGCINNYIWKYGHVPWNKGLNKEIDSRLKKCTGMKGKTFTEEHKDKISLKTKSYRMGKKLSEKTKIKISNSHKGKPSPRKGFKLPESHINKIKEARKKQILPVKDTKIELKIQNYLKILGLEFFTHQYMEISHGYQCDIFIPSMKMVIECDGIYWHKYPVGTELDHIRTKELIENGFKVIRLWEHEINDMGLNDFEERIKCL